MNQTKKIVYANDSFDRKNNNREINADFSCPVIVETNMSAWQISSVPTSKQKCLELVGNNKSRMTTVVQFSPGRAFKHFGHDAGVEFLVLSGIYSDADGDYGAGCYVRIPAKMYHAPFTRDGCTILFKLGQFQRFDRKRVIIDSKSSDTEWMRTGEPGVSRFNLHHFSEETVSLYRIRHECWITFKNNENILELFVCEGSIFVEGERYEAGAWLRYPAGNKIKVSSKGSACLYVKTSLFPI